MRRLWGACAVALLLVILIPLESGNAQLPCIPQPSIDDKCESWVAVVDVEGTEESGDVAIDNAGKRVFAVGSSASGGDKARGRKLVVSAHDVATGEALWTFQYGGNSTLVARVAAVSADDEFLYVAGDSTSAGKGQTFLVVAFRTTDGDRVWTKRYVGPTTGETGAFDLAVAPESDAVYVTGVSEHPRTNSDITTLAYEGTTGRLLWVKRYAGKRTGGIDFAESVATAPDGKSVFVTGRSAGRGSYDFATLAYAARSGRRLWLERYNLGKGNEQPLALTASPDGTRVIVTGTRYKKGSSAILTLSYDAMSGRLKWANEHREPSADRNEGWSIALSKDSQDAFVTGLTGTGDASAWVTLAMDTVSGEVGWSDVYDSPEREIEFGTEVVTSDSRVYVTGFSVDEAEGADYATVAYELTGVVAWIARYNHSETATESDLSKDLVVAPDWNAVYVSGTLGGGGIGTVAYSR